MARAGDFLHFCGKSLKSPILYDILSLAMFQTKEISVLVILFTLYEKIHYIYVALVSSLIIKDTGTVNV